MRAIESYTINKKQLRNAYYKNYSWLTIWISVYKPQIYHIAESNRIEKIDSVERIESNRNFFLPELECSIFSL